PDGWTEVSDTYRAPGHATKVAVQLNLQWAPDARVAWSQVELTEIPPPASRVVRLAAAHLRPWAGNPPSKMPMDNCRRYEPLIAEAGRRKADLIVLGEVLAAANLGLPREQVAEPVPGGPSVEYFGRLAKAHNLYVVAGLHERAGPLVYNVAVLLGPDGQVRG